MHTSVLWLAALLPRGLARLSAGVVPWRESAYAASHLPSALEGGHTALRMVPRSDLEAQSLVVDHL